MSTKKPHILPNKSVPDNAVVLGYLNNDLGDEAKRQLEEMLTEDQLLGDAMEGLKQLKDGNEAAIISNQLNRMIQEKIRKRRKIRLKSISFPLWIILLITTLLLLMLAGYVIISKLP
jgi:hypothetical protein